MILQIILFILSTILIIEDFFPAYLKAGEKLSKLLPNYYNKVYSVFTSSDSENLASYCSKFIYTLYKDAGKEMGENIELVNESWPILPYDFIKSSQLENIRLD